MNKGDLVEKIAAAHGISKTASGGAIDTIIDAVTSALKKGDRVTLVGFGTFSVSQRKDPPQPSVCDQRQDESSAASISTSGPWPRKPPAELN